MIDYILDIINLMNTRHPISELCCFAFHHERKIGYKVMKYMSL